MIKLIVLSCLVALYAANPLGNGEVFEDGPIDIKEANYHVSLFNSSTGELFCSGSIVSKHFILTTGRCLYGREGNILIRVGSSFNDEGGDVFVSERVIFHPSYSNWNQDFDFALIQVSQREIDFTETQGPADLATVAPRFDEFVTVIGQWQGSNSLRRRGAQIMSFRDCRNLIFVGLNQRTFCSVVLDPTEECISHEGAPVVMQGTLVGILIQQHDCNLLVSSNIAQVYDWIQRYIY